VTYKSQQIWLIRHGETAWSLTGQHTGRTDLPLLPESESKLLALRPHLSGHSFARVWTSPLQRARKTAELVGFPNAQLEDDLMEWNYGVYDGKTKEDIRALVPGWTIWTHGVVGGETLDEVAARARKVLDRARAVTGDVALVAHGHILRILASCWVDLPPIAAEHFALSTGAISVLSYENELPVLAQWNLQP
jgi:broad specificity phosphatase PhoE